MIAVPYTIHHHWEEAACDFCGCPLYVGDTALEVVDTGRIYCGFGCADEGEPDEEE